LKPPNSHCYGKVYWKVPFTYLPPCGCLVVAPKHIITY